MYQVFRQKLLNERLPGPLPVGVLGVLNPQSPKVVVFNLWIEFLVFSLSSCEHLQLIFCELL